MNKDIKNIWEKYTKSKGVILNEWSPEWGRQYTANNSKEIGNYKGYSLVYNRLNNEIAIYLGSMEVTPLSHEEINFDSETMSYDDDAFYYIVDSLN